ncbi:hypothetical protein CKAH01_03620 [Colletotrichum kahawae]|uniref:Uncharacterized protein n=1 Tax=Colletotrichum kahawae TaxID=34407 RepID=A0AAD9YQH3_COLKA|nr:hypothetical protein CKAH01_03620 [Colletotrichum kahawae]
MPCHAALGDSHCVHDFVSACGFLVLLSAVWKSPFETIRQKHTNAQKNPKTRPHQLRPDSRDVLQPAHDGRHCTSRGAVDALHSRALHAGQALHGNHTLTGAHL